MNKVPKPQKVPRKKEGDYFWYIVVVLAIICFSASFWVFYLLTSKLNTKNVVTTPSPVAEATPDPFATDRPTLLIGEGPEAHASSSPTPMPSASPSASPSAKPSAKPSATPKPSEAPVAAASPEAAPSKAPVPTPPPVEAPKANYRVQIGSFSDRDEAAQMAEELAGLGYSVMLINEGGRTQIQLGSFSDQERALRLAEEVTQKGYSVVVKRSP